MLKLKLQYFGHLMQRTESLKKTLMLGKIQGGLLPKVVLKRIKESGTCQVSVGEGVVIPVTKGLASTILELLEMLEDEEIEIDVEEVAERKINLFYNN